MDELSRVLSMVAQTENNVRRVSLSPQCLMRPSGGDEAGSGGGRRERHAPRDSEIFSRLIRFSSIYIHL